MTRYAIFTGYDSEGECTSDPKKIECFEDVAVGYLESSKEPTAKDLWDWSNNLQLAGFINLDDITWVKIEEQTTYKKVKIT